MGKQNLLAVFKDPLKADDAMSNLSEAGYSPKQKSMKGKVTITVPVTDKIMGSAKETLQDSGAISITLKKAGKIL